MSYSVPGVSWIQMSNTTLAYPLGGMGGSTATEPTSMLHNANCVAITCVEFVSIAAGSTITLTKNDGATVVATWTSPSVASATAQMQCVYNPPFLLQGNAFASFGMFTSAAGAVGRIYFQVIS